MEQMLHDLNERMDAEKAKAHAGTMTNEDNSATAKDMADSFQASVGMVKWEVEQPLQMMEVKVARELEWLSNATILQGWRGVEPSEKLQLCHLGATATGDAGLAAKTISRRRRNNTSRK